MGRLASMHMEHLNRTAKDALGQHSHLNPKSVTHVGKCVGLFRNARKQFDTVTDVHHSIGKHVCASAATDLTKITKQLVESQVFRETSNRSHDSFAMKGLTDSINHKKFIEWLSTHIAHSITEGSGNQTRRWVGGLGEGLYYQLQLAL